ncbi:MAG: hypothetical protein QOJ67_2660 [Acidimicrobiaceae bacterium]
MPDRVLSRFVAAVLIALWFNVGVGSGIAAADNCSGPADCEQTGGYNTMIAVVGGAGAVIAAVHTALQSKKDGEAGLGGEDGEQGEGSGLAIVQVSVDRVELGDQPVQVTLTGWNADEKGQVTQVPMPLSLDVPWGSGVSVTPIQGTGTLVASFTASETGPPEGTESVVVTARGDWEGKSATQPITVTFGDEYRLELS